MNMFCVGFLSKKDFGVTTAHSLFLPNQQLERYQK